jgi:ElaB/YqjD/DUF883 family membrane-anchored ribosome-binding protein
VNSKPKLVEEQPAESDFIDDIAALLPTEQRPLWYRDMSHLRRLPPDDEMLRIARAMGFLALVTRQTPAQIAIEREQIASILSDSIKAMQSARQDAIALHRQLDERLTQLPATIAEGISPAAIAGKLSESLRQQFVASGIPETAKALAVVSKQTKQIAGEFDCSSKQLTDSYRGAADEARRALNELRASIEYATATAKQAAHDLTHTFLREYKWSVLALCSVALALGFALGTLYYRWINRIPAAPEPTSNTVVVPSKTPDASPNSTATHSTRKTQRKPASPDQAAQ